MSLAAVTGVRQELGPRHIPLGGETEQGTEHATFPHL